MPVTVSRLYEYCVKNWGLLVRYTISGGAGVVANLIVFGLLVTYYHLWYVYGAVCGFVAAYLVTFSMHKWWTFTATAQSRTVLQGAVYLVSALLGLALTIVLLTLFIDGLGVWPIVAQFFALGIVAVLSFIWTSQMTFHEDETRLAVFFEIIRTIGTGLARQHRFWLSLLTIVLVVVASVRLAVMPLTITSDAIGYAKTADLILGNDVAVNGARYLKPLAPGFVALLSGFGFDTTTGVLVQSVLFYFLLGYAVYWFGWVLFTRKAAGFVMAVVVTTSFPIVKYGLDYLTETGAWTFYFMSLAAMVLWHRTLATKWLWLICVTLLAGVLWKEYAVLAGLMFLFLICTHSQLSLRSKIHTLLQSAALVCVPWFMWQYYVYDTYHYTYLDWFKIGAAPEAYATMYTVPAVIKSLFVLLGIGWVYVLFGLTQWSTTSPSVRFMVKIMVIPSFGFLLWGYVSSRLFFALVPLASIFVTLGIVSRARLLTQICMVILFVLFSMLLVWTSFVPDIRALIDTITYGK